MHKEGKQPVDYFYKRRLQICEKDVSLQILPACDVHHAADYETFKSLQDAHEELCDSKSYGFSENGHQDRPERFHVLCSSRDGEGRSQCDDVE